MKNGNRMQNVKPKRTTKAPLKEEVWIDPIRKDATTGKIIHGFIIINVLLGTHEYWFPTPCSAPTQRDYCNTTRQNNWGEMWKIENLDLLCVTIGMVVGDMHMLLEGHFGYALNSAPMVEWY